MFISNRVKDDRDGAEDLSIDLKEDYVCVMELGLFELSLRLTDNKEGECILNSNSHTQVALLLFL